MSRSSRRPWPSSKGGFTLVELLVAGAIFLLLLGLLLSIVSHITQIWQQTEGQRIRQQVMRLALDRISRDLQGLQLQRSTNETNSFQFVINPAIASDLLNPQAAFWQTTLTGDTSRGDVAEVGYFVRLVSASNHVRGELCRIEVPPTAADSFFADPQHWLTMSKIDSYAPPSGANSTNPLKGILADHVIGLWITPYQGTNALSLPYDSRTGSRPTSVEVALAVIDPRTAQRVGNPSEIRNHYNATPENFVNALDPQIRGGVSIIKTRVLLPNPR